MFSLEIKRKIYVVWKNPKYKLKLNIATLSLAFQSNLFVEYRELFDGYEQIDNNGIFLGRSINFECNYR